MNYVTMHLHCEQSLLDSCTNYKLYVDRVVELGQKAICFTEHGNIYSWVYKKMYCDENNIKYLHGVEIYLTETLDEKIRDNYHTILIARNFSGVKELNKLIDISTQDDHKYYKPRITFDEFLNISDNIITTSACLASPLNRLSEDNPYYEKLLKKYDYYEIQPHVYSEEQKVFNQKLYQLSLKYSKPLICGTDSHSINTYKAECRSILQKSKKIEYSDEDKYDLTYKSYDELVEMFKNQGVLPENVYLQAIENTNVMADSVKNFELDTSFKYPKLYDNEEVVFKKLINEKYKYKIANNIIQKDSRYVENIKEEFRVLKKIGMIGFMLFMSELMTWCRENNIPFGNCRGSVGGSTIAYILDIIDLNPTVWNTVFSRFANEDRIEIGDIDVDISPSQRELVYNHIIEKFGADYTSYILAIGTISDKGTIDAIGRALHYTWKKDNADKKEESSPYHSNKMMSIKSEYEFDPDYTKSKYPELFYYFDGLLGTAISQSMHPAGIIVSPITLPDNYGTFWSDGKRIISINMEEVHDVSLVKYDILGLKNIEIIKDSCDLIGVKYPLSHEVNWNDSKVWNDIVASNVGIFQFEGDYAFDLLKRYIPTKINDLSLINAALRPSGASYRDRLIAREFNKNPSVQIDELLKDNNGFLVFQEDVIAFLQKICGLSGSDADNVRRAIGRKQLDRLQQALPSILEGYCNVSDKTREIAEEEAKEFLQIIENASSYMFGYNHSTGYSMIGYLCGYYRYYHPLEFVTAYLNNANNEDDINNGTKLASLKDISINPIKFRYSKAEYFPDKIMNCIYKGLSSIKFLSNDVSEKIYELKNKSYSNFLELLRELPCDSRQTEILIKLDFFSEFGKAKKLLSVYKYFQLLNGKKQIKKANIEKLNIKEDCIRKYSRETDKTFLDVDINALLQEIYDEIPDVDFAIEDKIKHQFEFLGHINTVSDEYENYCFVLNVDVKYSPKIQLYHLDTGKTEVLKIAKKMFFAKEFDKGNMIVVNHIINKPKSRLVNGLWVKFLEDTERWIEDYEILS